MAAAARVPAQRAHSRLPRDARHAYDHSAHRLHALGAPARLSSSAQQSHGEEDEREEDEEGKGDDERAEAAQHALRVVAAHHLAHCARTGAGGGATAHAGCVGAWVRARRGRESSPVLAYLMVVAE